MWILCEERQPDACGKYGVKRVKGRSRQGRSLETARYLWNGSYWVTPGNSPTRSVVAWWEEDAQNVGKR